MNKKLPFSFLWILAGVIFISLIATLLFTGGFQPAKPVGSINNQKISKNQFQNALTGVRVRALLRYGKLFEQLEKMLDLEEEAWQQLILLNAAQKHGLKVSNQEVVEEIAKNDFFFRNNRFDQTLYKGILQSSFKCTPKEFEESIRQSLLIAKFVNLKTKDITVSEAEILNEYKETYEKLAVTYAIFDAEKYKENISITDEEARALYIEERQNLRMPLSINVEYIKLLFPPDGGVQKEVETKYKAIALFDQHAITKDLKKTAEANQYAYQETGYFSKLNPPEDLGWELDTLLEAFKMREGAIHEPVELKDGYLVFKIKGIKKAHIPTLEEVLPMLKEQVLLQKTRALSQEQALSYIDKIKPFLDQDSNNKNFEIVEKNIGIKLQESGLVSKKQLSEVLDIDPKNAADLLTLNTMGQTTAILSQRGACLIYVQNFQPITMDDFHKQKINLKEVLINRQDDAFKKFLTDLLDQAVINRY